jgi:hypothetical protein
MEVAWKVEEFTCLNDSILVSKCKMDQSRGVESCGVLYYHSLG